MSIEFRIADYRNPKDANVLVELLNNYASDPMGGAEALSEHTRTHLVEALAKVPNAFTVLCFVDAFFILRLILVLNFFAFFCVLVFSSLFHVTCAMWLSPSF